MAPTLGC